MPLPASVQIRTGSLPVTPQFSVSLAGPHSERLQAAALRTWKRLEDKTGTPLPRQLANGTGTVTISIGADGSPVQGVEDDESYTLEVNATAVRIQAADTLGAMHALQTLVQLVQPGDSGYVVPAVTIQDAPRFRWRGLMIDCSRHFEPIDVLKRNIDAMAAVKLNVFHWHLTDDQGFRIESKVFPKLTANGSDGLFYTQEEARGLIRYARDRGIRVVPEFEMPGHSTAWLVAYPELASGPAPDGIRREFGISDVAIDPTREETYKFLEQFLGEMAGIFPDSYLHIGGDETPAPEWKTNPKIVQFKKAHDLADNDALQAYFNGRVLAILAKLNRRMVGWDEIFNPALPKDVVVQSWRGEASLAKGAQQGYQGVLSAPYYLDGMKPAGVHYLADPVPADTKLSTEQQKLILGGEVCMWAEHLDQRTIDSRIWPRTAAISERFWSAQSVRDVDDMYARLTGVSLELESLGLKHVSVTDNGLRSLAGSEDIAALRTFSLAFEPVSFGERYHQQHTSQLTPLTGFVDAVRPDPPIHHQLDLAAKRVVANSAGTDAETVAARVALEQFFRNTAASVPAVQKQIASAPRLEPMRVRSEQLAALSQDGLDALRYVGTPGSMPGGWKERVQARIAEAKKPSALVRFTFLDALSQLVSTAR